MASIYLKLGVSRYVGLPAHSVVACVGDLLVLGQRVVGPCHLDGVVAEHRGLHAHRGEHGGSLWDWSVRSMKQFIQINIRVYGVCKQLANGTEKTVATEENANTT